MLIVSYKDAHQHCYIKQQGLPGCTHLMEEYCGDPWCCGACGRPALVLSYPDPDLGVRQIRAVGSVVAVGPVFMCFRGTWTGTKRFIQSSESIGTEHCVIQDKSLVTKFCNLIWW